MRIPNRQLFDKLMLSERDRANGRFVMDETRPNACISMTHMLSNKNVSQICNTTSWNKQIVYGLFHEKPTNCFVL